MAEDIDLGKISLTPKGTWNEETHVEFNDVWKYGIGKFLALKDSVGIAPSDDGVNWYELSSQGLSAYQMAVNEGFQGSVSDWLAYLRQPAIDAADVAKAAVASLNITYQQELEEAKNELVDAVEDAVVDKVVRPLSISSSESKIGSYKMSGEDIDIYEKSVYLEDLPTQVGETKSYTVADEPLGYGVYFNVESFVASTGKSLTGSFFNNYYEIVDFAINENLHSTVTVKCNRAVTMATRGLLHLQYCKFYGDVVEFNVTVPSSVDKNAVSLSFPRLKFNKKLVFSYITDDSYSIFQCQFSAINKRKVIKDTSFGNLTFHWNMDETVLDGYTNPSALQCSDGGGIYRRYATTVACWPEKLKDQAIGQDVGKNWPWISEKEFNFFKDFGFMLCYHDVIGYSSSTTTQEAFDACLKQTADLFKQYVGITPKVLAEPGGVHAYITFGKGNDTIQLITAQGGEAVWKINKAYPFIPNFSLSKFDIAAQRIFAYGSDLTFTNDNPQYAQDLIDILTGFSNATDKESIYWVIGSAHRSSHWEAVLLKRLYDQFGAEALDNLWVPTLDEFYEYWYMANNSFVSKTITDTGVKFKLFVPKMPNFFFRDISVLLDGISSLDGVSISSGNSVYGHSFGLSEGKLLVNLNFDEKLLARAEKYVSIFEANYNAKYVYDDAYYFVQQLKPGLREGFLARLNVYVSPPTFSSFVINNGDAQTLSRIVNIAMAYTGQAPTEYIISENEDFSGGTWKTYAANVTFEISEGFTLKTLYAKLRNVYGVSAVKTDQITFAKPALVFNGISINSGDEKTSSRTVTVTFNYTGYPEYYWLSESPTLEGAVKTAFTGNPISFELSSEVGVKTLYGKMDDGTTVSSIASDTIELIDADAAILNSIVINSGDAFTASGTVSVLLNTINTITKYRIGTTSDLSSLPWQTYSQATISFASGLSSGALTLYAQVGNTTSESEVKSSTITIVQPVILSSVSLASGASDFTGLTVPVALTVSSGTATHYRLAESTSELSSKEWIAMSDNLSYTFASIGSKTLYAQVKNQVGESAVVSDSITLKEVPVLILIANVPTGGATISGVGFVNSQIPGNNPIALKDTQGNTVGTFVGKYKPYNEADYAAMNTKYSVNNVNGTGNGAYWGTPALPAASGYPNSMIWDGATKNFSLLLKSVYTNFTTDRLPIAILKGLTPGNYKVRLLLSDNSSAPTTTQPWILQVQDQLAQVLQVDLATKVINNNSNFYTFDSVTVDSDGYLFITQYWQTAPTSASSSSRISPICIIEIEKL